MAEVRFKLPVVGGGWVESLHTSLKKTQKSNVRYDSIFIAQIIRKQLDTDIQVDLSILKIPT